MFPSSYLRCAGMLYKVGKRSPSCDLKRPIGSGAVNCSPNQVKMCKMMKKVMKTGGRKKWHGVPNSNSPLYTTTTSVVDRGTSPISAGQRRRAEHVGAVLYDYIISLVNSGELHPDIVDSSVEISKVKVVADFSAVNVSWMASGTPKDEQTQELLDHCAGRLRQMLTGLRAIGRIPRINFVKDMSQARIAEIETLLKTADMGPDGEENVQTEKIEPVTQPNKGSVNLSRRINTDFLKFSHLSFDPDTADSGEGMFRRSDIPPQATRKSEFPRQTDGYEQAAGAITSPHTVAGNVAGNLGFRNNMYGVDQKDLMNKIMLSKKKAKDRNFTLESSSVESLDISDETISRRQQDHPHVVKPQMKPKTVKSFYTVADAAADDESLWNDFSKVSVDDGVKLLENDVEDFSLDEDVDDSGK